MEQRRLSLLSLLDENEFRRAGKKCRQVRERLGISRERLAFLGGLEVSKLQAFEEGISCRILPAEEVAHILLTLLNQVEKHLPRG